MSKITRLHSGATNGLINWLEVNFQDLDQYVVSFKLKDGTVYSFYDCYSFLEAMGLSAMNQATLNTVGVAGEFIAKKRE